MFVPTEAAGRRTMPSRADRWLNAFTTVEPGEARGALRLAGNVFCLLASYYLLKTAREALILGEGTAEVKSYAAAAQAGLLFAIVPLYSAVASRVSRLRLVNGVLLFFAIHLAVFEVLARAGYHLGVAFYLWVGVFNLVVVAQFWALANDAYTVDRGERLFPIVATGASLGAWFGARSAASAMAARLQPSDLFVGQHDRRIPARAARRGTRRGARRAGRSRRADQGAAHRPVLR